MKPPRGSALSTIVLTALYAEQVRGLTYGDGATSIDNLAWTQAFKSVNATGEAIFPGFNITASYPGAVSDNWALTIKVKADVPLGRDDLFFTGTTLQWKAPDNLLSDSGGENGTEVLMDPSWTICQSFLISRNLQTDVDQVSSNCLGTISAECIADLERISTSGFRARPNKYACATLNVPESCHGALGDDDHRDLVGFSQELKSRHLPSNGTYDLVRHEYSWSEFHKASDTEAYDKAIRQIWIAITVWGNSNGTEVNPRGALPNGSVTCLRASNIMDGSRGLHGLKNGSSILRVGFAWWTMIMFAAAVGFVV